MGQGPRHPGGSCWRHHRGVEGGWRCRRLLARWPWCSRCSRRPPRHGRAWRCSGPIGADLRRTHPVWGSWPCCPTVAVLADSAPCAALLGSDGPQGWPQPGPWRRRGWRSPLRSPQRPSERPRMGAVLWCSWGRRGQPSPVRGAHWRSCRHPRMGPILWRRITCCGH